MNAQADPTPWPTPATEPYSLATADEAPPTPLHGRGYFSQLGVVRRKPSRAFIPCLTWGKSYPRMLRMYLLM